jgi:CRP/FNR family transcriptional regulator, nitrogen oxide reductase regulator
MDRGEQGFHLYQGEPEISSPFQAKMSDKRKTPLELEGITPHMCSPDLRLQILGQTPFFAGLALGELEQINRLFHEQGFEPGQTIYYQGDPAERLYITAAGQIKLMRHTTTGKDVLLDLLGKGEFFGGLSPQTDELYPETAQAHTSVCTIAIAKAEFQALLGRRPEMTLQVVQLLSQRLQAAYEQVRQISAHPVEQRIAYTLLKLADKFGQPHRPGVLIQTPLSRDDLAEMTGATTETASRVISRFQKAGLIQTGRQWISILDRPALQKLIEDF